MENRIERPGAHPIAMMGQFFGDIHAADGRLSGVEENVGADKPQKQLTVELVRKPKMV